MSIILSRAMRRLMARYPVSLVDLGNYSNRGYSSKEDFRFLGKTYLLRQKSSRRPCLEVDSAHLW